MGIFDWFRRPPPIEDRDALVDYLDTRAAFLAQKSIFDYTRALSGPFFVQLIKEADFSYAVDRGRWIAYPLGLSAVAEMTYVTLLPAAGAPVPLARELARAAVDAFDHHPVPAVLGAAVWQASRADLVTRVQQAALHPPKYVKDITLPITDQFFAAMPIHQRLRGTDPEWVRNHLRGNLIRMYEDFSRRVRAERVVADLGLDTPAEAAAPDR